MGFFDYFPYSNFHELNLNWLLAKVKDLHAKYLLQEATLEQIQEEIKNLNVPEIVKEQINDMVTSGELTDLFTPTWKELYTQNKKFYLGDLYIISQSEVTIPYVVGPKFAHYNNILYEWDDQLLQLKNTLTNIPTNRSASAVIILVETKTPRANFFSTAGFINNITSKFPNAYIYYAGLYNYEPIWYSGFIMTNQLIGAEISALSPYITRILTGARLFIGPIAYITSTTKISSDPENELEKAIITPANIRNIDGHLYADRWYFNGLLNSAETYPTNIAGLIGNGIFVNQNRIAIWSIPREREEIIIQPDTHSVSSSDTNRMYSPESILA